SKLKYFFPDSQDFIDPSFDFVRETRNEHRVRQRDDHYPHEVFDVSTLITLGNLNISWAIQENGTVIRNGTVPVANITLGSAT
ncbi:DUF4981 domain-containing protein, partial [Salmonella enterica subsp. enterica serovar Montevideo]|nr:DUF4981 domain-containing protein [Salmonella enterica subsp. enterica serovar Montevideo]